MLLLTICCLMTCFFIFRFPFFFTGKKNWMTGQKFFLSFFERVEMQTFNVIPMGSLPQHYFFVRYKKLLSGHPNFFSGKKKRKTEKTEKTEKNGKKRNMTLNYHFSSFLH